MLVVRDQFTAKPGQASKLAKVFRDFFAGDSSVRVMTDVVGDYNTVILELEVKSLADYESMMAKYQSGELSTNATPEAAEEMSKYTERWLTGRREIYRVIE
jgi:hypothetical protein